MKASFVVPVIALLVGCATPQQELPTQSGVDLKEYVGMWYEQARLPNRFQKDCVGDVKAVYTLHPDNTIGVTNQCRTQDGSTKIAEAEGRLSKVADPRDPAKLEVRFAPEWTSWLPMVWGDYWIIKLSGDYQYSLVGTPDRKYLWVLARKQNADDAVVTELLDYAANFGFPTAEVIRSVD